METGLPQVGGHVRKLAKGVLIVLLVLGGMALWLRRFGGHLEQKAVNPVSSTVAEVRLNTLASGTDADVVSVRLYPSLYHLGDTIFDASTYGGGVRISWRDKSHLIVHIERPEQIEIHRQLNTWKDIRIIYQ